MALITKAIRGTQDVLPADSYKWQHAEQTALAVTLRRNGSLRQCRAVVSGPAVQDRAGGGARFWLSRNAHAGV